VNISLDKTLHHAVSEQVS